ncbi:hypothetical protein L7F22_004726 [Adiantum nelumboides]|nr:hypothetical protein [Adiantum nelumboides]
MSHLATLSLTEPRSEMRKCGSLRSPESSEEKIICPKPQRVAVANLRSVDFIKPIRQVRSMSPVVIDGSDAGCEILDIFLSKSSYGDFGGSPPFFSGSPPSRAANPLVRDTQFLHPHAYPVATSQAKVPAGTPIRANPSVRIEGFECSARGFECTGRDAGRRVPAFA